MRTKTLFLTLGLIGLTLVPLEAQQGPRPGPGGPGGPGMGPPPPGGPGGAGRTSNAARLGADVPDVSSGTVTTNIDADVPAWIRDNFHGIRAFLKDGSVVLQTRSLPPYTSPYWGQGSARYSSQGMPLDLNPNKIQELAVTLTVPAKPVPASSNPKSTGVECPMGVVGIAVDGLVIFNSVAAPPDYLANEVASFDGHDAHPTDRGEYHYHTEPAPLIPSSGPHNELIGIALDGFPIYGPQNDRGVNLVDAGGSKTNPNKDTVHFNWFTNDQDPTPSGLPHYRAVANYFLKTTETSHHGTVPAGTVVEVRYLLGKYLGGKKGTVSY